MRKLQHIMLFVGIEKREIRLTLISLLALIVSSFSSAGIAVSQSTIATFNFDNDTETGWTYDAWGLNWDANRQCSWSIGNPNGGRGYNEIRGQRGYVGNADPLADHTSTNAINNIAGQGLKRDSKKEGESGHFNNSSEWFMSPPINCADYFSITLDYYRWANFEPGYDYGFIEVSTDGSTWNEVYAPSSLQDNSWVKHTLDISKYADRQSTVYIRWRSESDQSIFYSGWNIDDITITGVYNINDNTSSISSGAITPPSKVSSLTDTYAEKIIIGEFIIADAGSGDNLPTIVDTLKIVPGTNNSISDWKKAITNIYLYEEASGIELKGEVLNDVLYFTGTEFLTIADGDNRIYQLSFYVEPNLSALNDNDQFEFVLDYGNVATNAAGSIISSGVISTGASRLFLDIEATQLSFLVEPEQLVSVDRNLLPHIKIAATDANGNVDVDYSGTISLSNSGGLSMTGHSESTLNGVAIFTECQFTQTGGPVILQASHSGSSSIADASSNVNVIIENSLSNAVFFDNFDNSGISGWTSGSNYGGNSWQVEKPDGGRGYSSLRGSRGYVGNADPTSDYSSGNGNNVYGQGLGQSSKTEGVSGYFNSAEEWLMSPAIDLTNYYNTQLRFFRWANMEPYYDTAYVEISIDGINWIDLEHPQFPTDNSWTQVFYDISSIADRQPTVYIRWRTVSDGSIYYAGWNIDDVEINGIFSPVTNWTGTVSPEWNNGQNWSSGMVPTRLSNVFIESGTPFKPEISGVAECNEMVIRKNAAVEIKNSGTLTVFGDVKIETDKFNYGAIVDHGTLIIHGTGLMSRYITARQWNYVSSPIETAVSTQFGEEIYAYNEPVASNGWLNGWELIENQMLEIAKGYDVYKFKDDIINLEGKFNTGNIGITVTNTDGPEVPDHEGWNLIGNPYPSAIDWDASGWTKTNINDAIYIWDEDQQNFVTYISGVGTNGGSRYIPPMQGFFVRVQSPGNGYIGMNNGVRITNTDSKFKSTGSSIEGLKLRIEGDEFRDEAIVRYSSGANHNFDAGLDAHKKFSSNGNVPQVFTMNGKEEFLAINTLPSEVEYTQVPVYVSVASTGEYKLTFDGAWNIEETKTVYLEDVKADTMIDLLSASDYVFESGYVENDDRFVLHVGMPLSTEFYVTDPTVFGMADGLVDLRILGGVQPLTSIVWSSGENTEDLSGVKAGMYIVTITDAANNTLIDTVVVNQPNYQSEESLTLTENEEQNAFTLYELDHNIHISSIDNSASFEEVNIFSMEGKLIHVSTEHFIGEAVIHLDQSLQGVFIVQIEQGGKVYSEKLILH